MMEAGEGGRRGLILSLTESIDTRCGILQTLSRKLMFEAEGASSVPDWEL